MVQVRLNLIVMTFLMFLQNLKHQLRNVKDVKEQEKPTNHKPRSDNIGARRKERR